MPSHPNATIALFADDTIFYAASPTFTAAIKRLQSQIDLTIPWFKDWKISINASKTKVIKFTHNPKRDSTKIKFENSTINWSQDVKYLRITIDDKVKFSKHLKNILRKAKAAKFKLFPLLNPKSPLSIKTKLYIYKTYLRPIILYAAPLWTPNISNSSWKKLEAFQSKTLRSIINAHYFVSNKTIRNSLKIQSLKEYTEKDASTLTDRLANSHYNHIADIVNRMLPKEHFLNNPLKLK